MTQSFTYRLFQILQRDETMKSQIYSVLVTVAVLALLAGTANATGLALLSSWALNEASGTTAYDTGTGGYHYDLTPYTAGGGTAAVSGATPPTGVVFSNAWQFYGNTGVASCWPGECE